jgi:hypothetical protein
MQWQEIRDRYPQQWLVVEALEAHSEGGRRVLEELAVLETCPDSASAMKRYQKFHRDQPARELYVLHTDRKNPDVTERRWLGIRASSRG